MKIDKSDQVPLENCRSRALEFLSLYGRQDLVVANCVALAIWPTHQMTSQGAGAAASRILKGLEKDGLVQWTSTPSSWGYRITSAGRALVDRKNATASTELA